ncbi:MAG: hypothetical protein LBM77_02825 [Spirochaetaceae bacterium]|jgi:hypothetical protein|nr:hypothetical protein [Spirochaetaceae bacterium]
MQTLLVIYGFIGTLLAISAIALVIYGVLTHQEHKMEGYTPGHLPV